MHSEDRQEKEGRKFSGDVKERNSQNGIRKDPEDVEAWI